MNDVRGNSDSWVGEAVFNTLHNPPPGYEIICGRPTSKQNPDRLGDVWPEMWKFMSTKQKDKVVADWRMKCEQGNDAKKRGNTAETHALSMLKMYAQLKNDETNSDQVTTDLAHDGAEGDFCDRSPEVVPSGAGGRSLRIDGKFRGGRRCLARRLR